MKTLYRPRAHQARGTPLAIPTIVRRKPLPNRRCPARAPRSIGVFMLKRENLRPGNLRWGLIAALLGLPLPIILIAFLFVGGCR